MGSPTSCRRAGCCGGVGVAMRCRHAADGGHPLSPTPRGSESCGRAALPSARASPLGRRPFCLPSFYLLSTFSLPSLYSFFLPSLSTFSLLLSGGCAGASLACWRRTGGLAGGLVVYASMYRNHSDEHVSRRVGGGSVALRVSKVCLPTLPRWLWLGLGPSSGSCGWRMKGIRCEYIFHYISDPQDMRRDIWRR